MSDLSDYLFIASDEVLQQFGEENQGIDWIAFDTEFIGERRYTPLLCLIQVKTVHGNYILDPIHLNDLSPFLQFITDEKVLKITHAGENDYQLLHAIYGVIPINVFDTQVAAGFLGYGYPTSFQKLLQRQIRVRISKSQMVTDWSARPLSKQKIDYALNDVLHLPKLWRSLMDQLEELGRVDWVLKECSKWTKSVYYVSSPDKDAYKNKAIHQLNLQGQAFLLRIYRWRDSQARERNLPRETMLPSKLISTIVKIMGSGKRTMKDDRRIPTKVFTKYWDTFNELYQLRVTDEEREALTLIPSPPNDDDHQNTLMDLLSLILKYKCQEQDISPILLLNRSDFNRMKRDRSYFPEYMYAEWRKEVLGEELLDWFKRRERLNITLQDGQCVLEMN